MNKPLARHRSRRRSTTAHESAGQREYRGADRRRPRRSPTARASRSSRSTRRATAPPRRRRALGFPGQYPYTRGIYATMHRGRTWTQRQLIGLGTPADYNAAPARHPRPGRDRGLADPVQLGVPRLRHGRGRRRAARHLRRRRQQRRPHGPCLDGVDLARDVVRDERSVAVHAARLHARRRRSAAASTGARSPARRTRATTSRTSSPTTCSSASRCRARGAS